MIPKGVRRLKGARRLAAVLFLKRDDGEELEVMVGSTAEFVLTLDASCTTLRNDDFEKFEEL